MKVRSVLPSAIMACLGLFAVILPSCSTVPRSMVAPPEIPGAAYVGNKSCVECHADYTRAFPSSAHARIHVEGAPHSDSAGCESCHGPGSLHVTAGGGRGKFIVNPGREPQACFTCHVETHAQFKLPQHHPVL